MLKDLNYLFQRDLQKLKAELEAYENEEDLWRIEGQIANSGGTLAVHLCGNLRAFIGKEIGEFDYVRDREFEFSGTPVKREEIYKWIEESSQWLKVSLEKIEDWDLNKDFPIQPFPQKITYQNFLLHLYGHLNYHLGQINYHRRLVANS
ncbi:DUF1572 family protein [Algoriphagus sediminis]|uniref:DUF1572 family protein n=1 Tax=Algoriphagus sediminis TaxID=3057113 RepID=A0ABT7YDC7_9BACT|nr:DUF1572 family protein [Algoriphagus sediminis]MDN3204519.1 DUF1572 family protein [Algoriphagus sediminis]